MQLQVVDFEHLHTVVRGYVTEYNNMNKRPMHYLTVFFYLIRNMAKASRVLKQPAGHLVLVGGQGVGRHSLARMAAHASDCHVHQFETSKPETSVTPLLTIFTSSLDYYFNAT